MKDKRVRTLEVLISLQEILVEDTVEYAEKSMARNKLHELKLEYRERTGHDYFPPIRLDEFGVEVKYGNN